MRTAFVVAVLAATAGCSGGDGGGAPDPTDTLATTGPSATQAPPPGAVPPTWEMGHFWKWRLESAATPTLEATTVVVSEDSSSYHIGSSDSQAAAMVFPFHVIALDAVSKQDMSWTAHGTAVQLLQFPMENKTWTADFWSLADANVTAVGGAVSSPTGSEPGFHITVNYRGGSDLVFMDAEWSAARGQFTRISTYFGAAEPFATATLTGEGNGTMDAKPFVATELVRWSADLADPTDLAPYTFNVGADDTLVLLACFLGGGQPAVGGGSGHFQATMVLADQKTTSCQATMPSATQYHASTLDAAPGQGEVQAFPVGAGGVTVEVFAIATG